MTDDITTPPRSTPVPDPTVLTTEALHRESTYLQESMNARFHENREHMNTLFTAANELLDEKLNTIDRQLALVEQQRVEQKADTKAAVDAALTAQKEAVKEQTTASERAIAKSEASTTKQLEQLSETFVTAIAGVTVALDDLKDRVRTVEALRQGQVDQRIDTRASAGTIIAYVAAGISALALLLVFYNSTTNKTPAQQPIVTLPTVTVPTR
jgi:hypothetical protein